MANTVLGRNESGNVVDIEMSDTGAVVEHPDLEAHTELGLAETGHSHPAPDLTHDHDGEYAPVHTHPYAADDHTHAGGAEHPDLAAHETLGLAAEVHTHDEYATDADLTTHAGTTHGTTAHAIGGVLHSGTLDHSALGSVTANQHHNQSHALGGGDHSGSLPQASVTNLTTDLAGKAASVHTHDYAATSHSHLDADLPASIARDTEVSQAITDHLAAATHGGEGGGEAFPVGSVFLSVVSTDPATLLGYGTWSQIAGGRFLVGQSADAAYDTAEETGGAATHTHADHTNPIDHTHTATVTDPQHAHVQGVNSATTGGTSGYTPDTSTNTRVNSGYSTSNAATGITVANASPAGAVAALTHDSPSNVPPYFVVYVWKRTA